MPTYLSYPSIFILLIRRHPPPKLFPYTTLFRSRRSPAVSTSVYGRPPLSKSIATASRVVPGWSKATRRSSRSEEHTSELQSRPHLVCRLLLEKKKPKCQAHPVSDKRIKHISPGY